MAPARPYRVGLALAVLVLLLGASSRAASAQTPQLSFDPANGACEDDELTIRGEGFPAGTSVSLSGGAADGPALDRFALTTEQPVVDANGSFEITLDGLPVLCSMGEVGIFALAEDDAGEVVAQARATYAVSVAPPASGSLGGSASDGAGRGAPAEGLLLAVALLLLAGARAAGHRSPGR